MMIYWQARNGSQGRGMVTHFVQYLEARSRFCIWCDLAGKPAGLKLGRQKAFEYPYLDCTNTVLDLGSFSRARRSVQIKGKILGVVWGSFFFSSAFSTGIEGG